MTTVFDLLLLDPINPVVNENNVTTSNKEWASRYHPLRNLIVHTQVGPDGRVYANWDGAFLPACDDDTLRMGEPATHPNPRLWRFETEADCELWFHTEVSNVVLAAWTQYGRVTQTSHTKPPCEANISEEVDAMYGVDYANSTVVVAIGEMKRNLIRPELWQAGNPSGLVSQQMLSRELRG